MTSKNANSCQTEIAGLGAEILALKEEIIALKDEIETLTSSPNDGGDYGSTPTPAPFGACTAAGDDAMRTKSWLPCCDGRKTELKPCRPNEYCYICPTRDESSSCDNVVCNNQASDYCWEVSSNRTPEPYCYEAEKYDYAQTPPCPLYTNEEYICNAAAWEYCRGFRGNGLCYDAQKFDRDKDLCPGPISERELFCYEYHKYDPTKDLDKQCTPKRD